MLRKHFAKKLSQIMSQRDIGYTELSRLTNINRDHLYHIMDGSKEIGIDTIERICNGLNISVSELFDTNTSDFETLEEDKIVKDIESLPDDYWDFKGVKTDELIHTLHPYPAVMIYPISRSILDIVLKYKEIDCLMDPYAGSGTVLVEGQLKNIPTVIGNDLNPLANLICKAKTTILKKKDIEYLNDIISAVSELDKNFSDEIKNFATHICENYSIVEKGEWSSNCNDLIADYFKNSPISKHFEIPCINNLGFWFRPETLPAIFAIKKIIDESLNTNTKAMLYCALSETIRFVSNTRNGEFKLYRMTPESILKKYYNVFDVFNNILKKNIKKMNEYRDSLPSNLLTDVRNLQEDSRLLDSVKDGSVDIVITSPPYGDSHTTVAYGQFSRLSNDLLGLIDGVNIDNLLLGGKKNKNKDINKLGSETLVKIYEKIAETDSKRADEVLDFYIDLDKSLSNISKKTKTYGYNFWVVGNRTVKKTYVPTDDILAEMFEKYGMKCLKKFYRNISNKVMPSKNSPTNVIGELVTTMCSEIILFFKKII